MDLIRIPELDMTLDELDSKLQNLARQKVELQETMLKLEGELVLVASVFAVRAIQELDKRK